MQLPATREYLLSDADEIPVRLTVQIEGKLFDSYQSFSEDRLWVVEAGQHQRGWDQNERASGKDESTGGLIRHGKQQDFFDLQKRRKCRISGTMGRQRKQIRQNVHQVLKVDRDKFGVGSAQRFHRGKSLPSQDERQEFMWVVGTIL